MRLHNNTAKTMELELFIGPGSWFKASVAPGAAVDVPDDMADAACATYGLATAPATASGAKKTTPPAKGEEK